MTHCRLVLACIAGILALCLTGDSSTAQASGAGQTEVWSSGPGPRVAPTSPCDLCSDIAFNVNHALATLQPINSFWIEGALAYWGEWRESLPPPEAARYDACFQNVAEAYGFTRNAIEAWAAVSDPHFAVMSVGGLLELKYALSSDVYSARAHLMRAARSCGGTSAVATR
jgi:hypothetical protein